MPSIGRVTNARSPRRKKDFDLTETAVRDWVRQADIDAGVRSDGLTSAATSPGRACC